MARDSGPAAMPSLARKTDGDDSKLRPENSLLGAEPMAPKRRKMTANLRRVVVSTPVGHGCSYRRPQRLVQLDTVGRLKGPANPNPLSCSRCTSTANRISQGLHQARERRTLRGAGCSEQPAPIGGHAVAPAPVPMPRAASHNANERQTHLGRNLCLPLASKGVRRVMHNKYKRAPLLLHVPQASVSIRALACRSATVRSLPTKSQLASKICRLARSITKPMAWRRSRMQPPCTIR